jgi:RNA polymerase sigma factor (sigma-70 family)
MAPSLHELLRAAADDDDAARDMLLREVYPGVRDLVHRTLDRDFRRRHPWMLQMFSTGDIVQDVFLAVVRSRPETGAHNEHELRAFLAAQVRSTIIDRVRFHLAQRRDARHEAPLVRDGATAIVPAHEPTPSALIVLDERARLLRGVLAELDAGERTLWQLRVEQELAFADVAQRLGLPTDEAARSAFRRLQSKLALRLHRLGIVADEAASS